MVTFLLGDRVCFWYVSDCKDVEICRSTCLYAERKSGWKFDKEIQMRIYSSVRWNGYLVSGVSEYKVTSGS